MFQSNLLKLHLSLWLEEHLLIWMRIVILNKLSNRNLKLLRKIRKRMKLRLKLKWIKSWVCLQLLKYRRNINKKLRWRSLNKKKKAKVHLISQRKQRKNNPNIENMEKANTAMGENTEAVKYTPLRSFRRDFKHANRSKRESNNGERPMKRSTPRKNKDLLKVMGSTNPDHDPKTVQPTTESTQNPPIFPSQQLLNPSTSKSSPRWKLNPPDNTPNIREYNNI